MVQYQILARKPLGPSGTGRKIQGIKKQRRNTTSGMPKGGRTATLAARAAIFENFTCVTLNGSGIQLAVGPQPLWLRNRNFGLAQRIMVKRLARSPHDPLGITDSACKNHLVVVSIQYGPFNTYIPIRSMTIGKSRVARDPITMHTSWRLNSDIASVTSIGYPRMKASGESSTTKHRLLHASGPHPIPPPNDPKHTNQLKEYAIFNQHSAQLTSSSTSRNTHPAWITSTNPIWFTVLISAQTSPLFQLSLTQNLDQYTSKLVSSPSAYPADVSTWVKPYSDLVNSRLPTNNYSSHRTKEIILSRG
ncbi:hypothetical protein F511_21804 [Dorcoceras hygrometricum]|uniref:Uncharacterized protein n=1 Tax=Dorcoceras hygrometricum TaxID=472368 RepID=A0A2Z7DH07_9LAMI|nr:hypothetical protein F511_21804 [Dorcoceras hygrometricum]